MLQPFYWNFDGLDVTFQGRIPLALVERLDAAKVEAQANRGDVLLEWCGVKMAVAESGAKGGYAYRCDTGPTGATWFFSKNQSIDNWNIRVSLKSSALASRGLGGARADIYEFLETIGASVKDASISRVDYCMDFLADDIEDEMGEEFTLEPNNFVMHGRCNRADHDDDAGMQMHGASGRYTSVTCGSMPGRQVIMYDKSREVRMRQKPEWWAHWNAARVKQGLEPLEGSERVWRVEVRAGKAYLKQRWGISSWEDLDNKLGDLFRTALEDIRLTVPSAEDSNRSRWPVHPLWAAAAATVGKDLGEMMTGAKPGVVKRVRRDHLTQVMRAMVLGLVATWTVATGTEVAPEPIADGLRSLAYDYVTEHREDFVKKRERAGKRYVFITQEETQGARGHCGNAGQSGPAQEPVTHAIDGAGGGNPLPGQWRSGLPEGRGQPASEA